jgi:hypothetical protein
MRMHILNGSMLRMRRSVYFADCWFIRIRPPQEDKDTVAKEFSS